MSNTSSPKINAGQPIFAIFLGWVALAGIADNFVTWQSWFEIGFMEKWRYVKQIVSFPLSDILDYFGWISKIYPSNYFEYIVLSLVFIRSLYIVDRQFNHDFIYFSVNFIYLFGTAIFILFIRSTGIFYRHDDRYLGMFVTLPILHLSLCLFAGCMITLAIMIYRYWSEHVARNLDSSDAHEDPMFQHVTDIVFWIFCSAMLAVATIFVAADLGEKL